MRQVEVRPAHVPILLHKLQNSAEVSHQRGLGGPLGAFYTELGQRDSEDNVVVFSDVHMNGVHERA